ncbi:hypothetical protein OCHUTO_0323 [Orientia chuto str. Dubai]|uniref:Uncharacterized protein n=1 Tax=Orientia chuto str. Dubai TaxID=1359168 RepID=A0A0F3MMS1_9RICK|nr:hypothetical protein [Candidatus Orientia mediorientalis]KJV56757.1 hypothetical protein OCHUTO_0323 [Orientia chuto str. Dubai]
MVNMDRCNSVLRSAVILNNYELVEKIIAGTVTVEELQNHRREYIQISPYKVLSYYNIKAEDDGTIIEECQDYCDDIVDDSDDDVNTTRTIIDKNRKLADEEFESILCTDTYTDCLANVSLTNQKIRKHSNNSVILPTDDRIIISVFKNAPLDLLNEYCSNIVEVSQINIAPLIENICKSKREGIIISCNAVDIFKKMLWMKVA